MLIKEVRMLILISQSRILSVGCYIQRLNFGEKTQATGFPSEVPTKLQSSVGEKTLGFLDTPEFFF